MFDLPSAVCIMIDLLRSTSICFSKAEFCQKSKTNIDL